MSKKHIRKQKKAQTHSIYNPPNEGEVTNELLTMFENTGEIDTLGKMWRENQEIIEYAIELVKQNYISYTAKSPENIEGARFVTDKLIELFTKSSASLLSRLKKAQDEKTHPDSIADDLTIAATLGVARY